MQLNKIAPLTTTDLQDGCWIVLIQAHRIPPHLLLIFGGEIYALHTGGKQVAEPLAPLLTLLRRRAEPAIFIEWRLPDPSSASEQLQDVFARCEQVEEGGFSCLMPIRALAIAQNGATCADAEFIFELLPQLNYMQQLGRVYELNAAQLLRRGSFKLQTYNRADVDAAIRNQPASEVS